MSSTIIIFVLLSKYSNRTIFEVLNQLSTLAAHYLMISTSKQVSRQFFVAFNLEIIRLYFASRFLVS